MKRGVPSSVANVVLTAGVVFAVTFAVGFTLRYRSPALRSAAPEGAAKRGSVFVPLPPASRPAAIVPESPSAAGEAGGPPAPLSASAKSPEREFAEPFDPPPPPMAAMPIAAPAAASAVAVAPALPDPAPVPMPAQMKVPPPRNIRLHFNEAEEGDATPDQHQPSGARRVGGPAIVTAALELNVRGEPLKLAGVKLPMTTDLCAPNVGYAARACADVTREALAARVGAKGEVSCQIVGGGHSPWPAVCREGAGGDLAAYLIEHGFALADDSDPIDYSAVEARAQAARSGLWSYR